MIGVVRFVDRCLEQEFGPRALLKREGRNDHDQAEEEDGDDEE